MSKLQSDALREAIANIKKDSSEKKCSFVENIELQIGLKNYDPQKDPKKDMVEPRHEDIQHLWQHPRAMAMERFQSIIFTAKQMLVKCSLGHVFIDKKLLISIQAIPQKCLCKQCPRCQF